MVVWCFVISFTSFQKAVLAPMEYLKDEIPRLSQALGAFAKARKEESERKLAGTVSEDAIVSTPQASSGRCTAPVISVPHPYQLLRKMCLESCSASDATLKNLEHVAREFGKDSSRVLK